jgi:plastocyanin
MERKMPHPMKIPTMTLAILSAAFLSAAGGFAQPPDRGTAQSVTVELSSFKFTPATLTLQQGKSYRIHFVNRSSRGHNFVAEKFFSTSTIAAEDQGKVVDGKVNLDGGEAADISLVPRQAGTFKSRCTHFMHSMLGMTGTITVEP